MRCLLILMSLVFLMTTQVSATPKYFINVKRLPGWGALRDNETPADIEHQSKASITEPCDRDLRFDDGRAANGGDDRADFVVSIMRVIDRLATPESHEIADAALASDRGPEETKPQLSGSILLSRLIVGLEARAMIGCENSAFPWRR